MIKLLDILNESIIDVVNDYVNKSEYDILANWGNCSFYTDDFIKNISGAKAVYMPLANPKTEDPEDHIVPVINGIIIDFAKVPNSGVSKHDRNESNLPKKLNPGYEESNWPRLTKLEDSAFMSNGVYGKLGYIKGEKYANWEYDESFGNDLKAGKYPIIMNKVPGYATKQAPAKKNQIKSNKLEEDLRDWFGKGKTAIKTKFNNLPQWFRDGFEKEGFKPELNEADPKVGTGHKPEGSGRRLYTDEDPTDTVRVKFKTAQDIKDTLSKTSFKSKSHARQSQVINLIHQRVRAAYNKAKDPEVKARLKRGLDYIEKRKEASKKKTQRLNKETADPQSGKAAPYGSGYKKIKS